MRSVPHPRHSWRDKSDETCFSVSLAPVAEDEALNVLVHHYDEEQGEQGNAGEGEVIHGFD